jgi:hypothetical protein
MKLMKLNFLFLGCLLFVFNSMIFSQRKDGITRVINAKSDKNTVLDTGPNFAASKSDQCYIVDGNESKGYIEMEFEDLNASKSPQIITLVVNCADVEYAESLNGFSVFVNSQKVGSISQINRNSNVEIPLDVNVLKSKSAVTLTLKANGEDGLYLLSKKSGFGAYLVFTY